MQPRNQTSTSAGIKLGYAHDRDHGARMLVEKLLGAASLCALVTAMTAINEHARHIVMGLMRGELTQNVGLPVSRALALAKGTTSSVVELTGDNMVITGFGFGALVLVGLMRRT